MAKDYNAIHYIQNQAKKCNIDDKLLGIRTTAGSRWLILFLGMNLK